jgi:hypothetical protein
MSHQPPPNDLLASSAPTPMDPAAHPMATRSNEALPRIVRPTARRSRTIVESPVTSRHQARRMATRSATITALQSVGIPSADPSTPWVFQPCPLGFPSSRAAIMAAGAPGSSREMEPPPGFTSTPMHQPMPWGMPWPAAPNGAALPLFSRPRAHRHPTTPSVPRFQTAAPTTYLSTGAPAPPPPRFGVRRPRGHVGASARPPPQSGPLSHHPIVSTLNPSLSVRW